MAMMVITLVKPFPVCFRYPVHFADKRAIIKAEPRRRYDGDKIMRCINADVKWPGIPICREHLAASQMRVEGRAIDSTFVPTVSAPAALQ
jgi:hypothetical protein